MSSDEKYMLRVPTDESGRLEILSLRPPLWEYILFANRLYVDRKRRDSQWRDFRLGYTMNVGPVVEIGQLGTVLSERCSYASALVANIERIVAPSAQDEAFGLPGEPGDAELIEHMATRIMDLYGELLAWGSETRALRVPDEGKRAKEILASFVSQPVRRTHEFVDECITSLEQTIGSLANGDEGPHTIELRVEYEIDKTVIREFERQLETIALKARRA